MHKKMNLSEEILKKELDGKKVLKENIIQNKNFHEHRLKENLDKLQDVDNQIDSLESALNLLAEFKKEGKHENL